MVACKPSIVLGYVYLPYFHFLVLYSSLFALNILSCLLLTLSRYQKIWSNTYRAYLITVDNLTYQELVLNMNKPLLTEEKYYSEIYMMWPVEPWLSVSGPRPTSPKRLFLAIPKIPRSGHARIFPNWLRWYPLFLFVSWLLICSTQFSLPIDVFSRLYYCSWTFVLLYYLHQFISSLPQ